MPALSADCLTLPQPAIIGNMGGKDGYTEGWRIVNTSAKDKTTRIKDYVCVCEGALYVMEKVDPPSNQNQKQIELLQKQIETLEKQNGLLMQENETLKNKLKNRSNNKK
jgi:hypothetical protein